MSDLLRFQPFHTNEEPIFYQGFGGAVRANYPNIPIEYTKVKGVRLENVAPISLGVSPSSSDSDIFIYVGFYVVSMSADYQPIITSTYVDEYTPVVRIITQGQNNPYNFYTNLFTRPNESTLFTNKIQVSGCMRKVDDTRVFYNGLDDNVKEYNTLRQTTPTELKLSNSSLVLNMYGLFIRQNGVVYHNWVPCIRKSDNACGFYNAVTGDFITSAGMSAISS